MDIREKTVAPTLTAYFHDVVIPWATIQFKDKPKSFKWYRDNAKVLCAFPTLAKARIDAVGKREADEFKEWRSEQGVSIHTVNSSIRVLRAVLHRATLERLRLPLVKNEITILPGAQSRERVLTREDETAYLNAATEPLKSVAAIMLDTGFRPEEVFRITWEHVNFADNGGRIFNPFGKSKAARRSVKMTARVRAILFARWSDADKPSAGWVFLAKKASAGHIVPNTIYEPHVATVKASGVAPFVLYSLRHTFLTRLGQSGCSPWTFARIAGHGDVNVSKHYVHATDDESDAAIDELEASETKMKQNRKRAQSAKVSKLRVTHSRKAS
jgi:integrase